MRKWTKAEREEASRQGKLRWAARKKRDVRSSDVADPLPAVMFAGGSAGSGGSANASAFALEPQATAIDVVRLIAHDVPADVIVKVVERILRS